MKNKFVFFAALVRQPPQAPLEPDAHRLAAAQDNSELERRWRGIDDLNGGTAAYARAYLSMYPSGSGR